MVPDRCSTRWVGSRTAEQRVFVDKPGDARDVRTASTFDTVLTRIRGVGRLSLYVV